MIEPRLRHLGGAGQQIVGKRRRQRLAGGIERHLFIERRADALREAAEDLAVDDHGIDQHAAVFDDHIVEDFDLAQIRIDRHRHRVRGITEGAGVALRFVAAGRLQPCGIDIGRQVLRTPVPCVRDVLEADVAAPALDLAVLQHDVGGIELQQLGADAFGALAELMAGGGHRAARHHHGARAPGAGGVGRHRGVAMHQAHFRDVDAKDLMRHLRQRGLHALAVGVDADAQLQPAIGRQPRGGLLVARHHGNAPAGINRSAVRRLLAVDRKAGADQPAVGFARALAYADTGDIDGGEGAAHRFGIIAAIKMFVRDVVERHLLRAHQVAQPHLARLQTGGRSNRIQHDLQREADAGARHPPIRQDRTLVGGHRIGAAAIGRHLVRTRQDARDLRGFQTRGERIGRVGAGIDGGLAIDAAQGAVAIRIHRDLVVMLPAVGAGDQMLAPVLDPAHGMAALHGEPGQADFLRQQNPFMAEAAADIGRDDADPALLQAEAIAQTIAHDMRHLAAAVEGELIEPVVEGRHHATAFQGGHALPRGGDFT